MITQEIKQRVVAELSLKRSNFEGSDNKFATSIGINAAQYNRIKNGELDRVISDGTWISLARMLNVNLKERAAWVVAETPVFVSIMQQLTLCQTEAISCIICDAADIGKTETAKYYAKHNKNAVYVDCSQVKTKQKLVRFIAKEFGVSHTGRYADVYGDLMYYLKTLDSPMVILDEAGDLQYEAYLELKAMWNATEGACGWCQIGADGLKEKIRRSMDCKKVGYTEIYRRYGKRFQRITPEGREDFETFTKQQAALIIKANAPEGTDIMGVLRKTDSSLTRIKFELAKL